MCAFPCYFIVCQFVHFVLSLLVLREKETKKAWSWGERKKAWSWGKRGEKRGGGKRDRERHGVGRVMRWEESEVGESMTGIHCMKINTFNKA